MPRKAWGSPAQLRAFRKMRAARNAKLRGKKSVRKGGKRTASRGRKATGTVRVKFRRSVRRRNPAALIANPGRPSAGYTRAYATGFAEAFGKKRRKSKKRRSVKRKVSTTMAKKRRKKSSARRSVRRRRRAVHRVRPSKRTRTIYINPGRRKRRRRRTHRRNPGTGSLLMRAFTPFAVGFVASMGAAVLDTALSKYPKATHVVKVAGAVAIAFMGRRYPVASTAAIAALAASSGYPLGVKLAGGMVAKSPEEAVKGLGEMAGTYPEIGALLEGGVGALLEGVPDEGESVMNYQAALNGDEDE